MKRFITGFISVDAGKPKQQQEHQPKLDPVGRLVLLSISVISAYLKE